MPQPAAPSYVDLVWLPLGAGEASPLVRWSGRAFERLGAARAGRAPRSLFHSALQVRLEGHPWVVEMTPDWGPASHAGGVVARGPVGLGVLGRSRLFRYQVHRTPDGAIPDLADAAGPAVRVSHDRGRALALLALVPSFPTHTWGRDDQATGEMWNSNSLTAWLLARSGHPMTGVQPPDGGRAPGWSAGLVVAARRTQERDQSPDPTTPKALSAAYGRRPRWGP